MVFNVVLIDNKKGYNEMYEKMVQPIHESLKGNINYVDSNIIIHIHDKTPTTLPTCDLIINGNECIDKEYIRTKMKDVIDLFIDIL